MNKIDFGDYYKFLTSLGLIMVASSIIIPWFFLKEILSHNLQEVLIQDLTSDSVNYINKFQSNIINVLTIIIPIIALMLLIFGIIIIFSGLSSWHKKQKKLDKKEELEFEILIRQISPMTQSEIVENTISDIKDDITTDFSENNIEEIMVEVENGLVGYMNIEDFVFNKLQLVSNQQYLSIKNQRIGIHYFKILLLPKNKKRNDIVVELKYYRFEINLQNIKNSISQLHSLQEQYLLTNKISPCIHILFIFKNEIYNKVQENNQLEIIQDYLNEERIQCSIQSYILRENELDKFDYEILLH